jgi:hypothetical protein
MIVAWNSLMISGLARAAAVFQNSAYLEMADRATRFILEQQQVEQRFHRLNYDGQASVIAQSEDYALFIKALLDLHQATASQPDQDYLDQTQRLQEDTAYLQRAEQSLNSFSGIMHRAPQACPSLFAALDWYRQPTLVRTTAGQMASLNRQYLPAAMLRLEPALPEGAIALVCEGLSCQEPARSVEQMQSQLAQR